MIRIIMLVALFIVPFIVGCNPQSSDAPPQSMITPGPSIPPPTTPAGTIVARVGNESITESDLERRIDRVEASLDYMRDEVEAGGPAFIEAFVTAIQETGIRTVALAGEIQDAALRDYARRHGYTVSPEEVASEVAEQQRMATQQPDVAATAGAYDPDYGTSTYWQEDAPRLLARSLIVEQLREDIVSGELTGALGAQRWDEFQLEVVRDTEIEILAPALVDDATVEEVLAYLEEAHRILDESRAPATTGQTDEQGVTKEMLTPAPSATPARCTALPADMRFDVWTVLPGSISVEVGGLRPGETPRLIVEGAADGHRSRYEERPAQPVGANGTFSASVGGLNLAERTGAERVTYTVKLIHERGVVY